MQKAVQRQGRDDRGRLPARTGQVACRDLAYRQREKWFLLHRLRLARQSGTFIKLSGKVEFNETFIGGKARNIAGDRFEFVGKWLE